MAEISKFVASLLKDPHFSIKGFLRSLIERRKETQENNHITREALLKASWIIYEIPETRSSRFITSDNPGFAINPNAVGLEYIDNIKMDGSFIFYLPLTPNHCLEISNGDLIQGQPFNKSEIIE